VSARPFTFYEFFAGGGMARAGLGAGWDCLFANDFDRMKAKTYRANWGADHFHEGDVHALNAADLPHLLGGGAVDLAWASSPCQDLSLAGKRVGLSGARSSAFWGFWTLMKRLNAEGRAPRMIVIENVTGLLTSHSGADFTALCQALADEGYRFGALEIDAARFLPQSRPRMFLIAAREPALPPPASFEAQGRRVRQAYGHLPPALKACWIDWGIRAPHRLKQTLQSLLETDHTVPWRTELQTAALIAQLSPLQAERLRLASAKGRVVAAAFRRTRMENGVRVQRTELRFDGLAGCLRTPGGGSSRQFIVVAEDGAIRSRWLTPREGARLMGLQESYHLPKGDTAAFKVIGDGVAAPVVRALAMQVLEPLLMEPQRIAAAE
jgi:DNA (cytosine-5)-methyltransferase 1